MKEENIKKESLPIGWVKCQLPDFCDIIMGQSPPSSTYNTSKEGLPFYQGKSEFGDLYPSPQKYCNKPTKIAIEGDVLMSVRAPVGPTNLSPHEACIGRGLASIRALDNIPTKFVLYLIRNIEPLIAKKGTGTTFKAISKACVETLSFILPPLPEQHRIVAKIEELFSRLDAGIANLEQARDQLKIYRQAVLKHAFEGKLTEKWRKQHAHTMEPAEKLLEKIKKERETLFNNQLDQWQKETAQWEQKGKQGKKPAKPKKPKELPPLTDEGVRSLPQIPNGWIKVQLNQLSDKITDGEHSTPKRTDEGYFLLSARNIQNGYIDLEKVDYIPEIEYLRIIKRCHPEEGDILISCSGSIGRICTVPGNFEFTMVRSVALVKIQSNKYLSKFLEYQLQSPKLQKEINSKKKATAQANLFIEPISKLTIYLCAKEEMHQIVAEIESRLSVCDKLEETVRQALGKAESLRQSILKKAFAGKLVPQDPADEPAHILLERIRAQKEKMNLQAPPTKNKPKPKRTTP